MPRVLGRSNDGVMLAPMEERAGEARFVAVTELASPLAHIVQGALEAEGIPVRLEREALSAVYGLETGMFSTRVLVPADEAERASAFIAEIESRH